MEIRWVVRGSSSVDTCVCVMNIQYGVSEFEI